jgi:excisionase family DNA binding protein
MSNKVLTVSDVAKELGLGKNSAYELFKQPDFPSFMIGKRYRTTQEALQEWLKDKPLHK